MGNATVENETTFICANCEHTHDIDEKKVGLEGEVLCTECYDEIYFICEHCDQVRVRDDSYSIGWNGTICQQCYEDDFFTCDRCENVIHNDHYGNDRCCEDCEREDEDEGEPNEREYHDGDLFTVKHKRAYACEIECYYPNSETQSNVFRNTDEAIGISGDGSLGNCGVEFQTPKLSGEKGAKLLKGLTKTLVDKDYKVNSSCGLHIHIDSSDFVDKPKKIRDLILFYLAFEQVIYSFLPYSRRSNRYCLPLSKFYHEAEIANCYSMQGIEAIWYREQDRVSIEHRKKNKYDSTRYSGVNIHSLLANGHIELRHHSGTLDYNKIDNWTRLHIAILDRISKGKISMAKVEYARTILNLKDKMALMFELLELDEKLKTYFTNRAEKFSGEMINNPTTLCAE